MTTLEFMEKQLRKCKIDLYASNEHRKIRVDGKWMHPEDVEEWLEREVEDEML